MIKWHHLGYKFFWKRKCESGRPPAVRDASARDGDKPIDTLPAPAPSAEAALARAREHMKNVNPLRPQEFFDDSSE